MATTRLGKFVHDIAWLGVVFAALGLGGCSAPATGQETLKLSDPPGIQHLFQVSRRIYSGSQPRGEEGFASLQRLGVKTIVSVDGAQPDVALARQQGIRYIHIPIGYDGVPRAAGEALARVVREAEGPYYIHCHHGMHRGPAAAAVSCIASGELNAQQALQVMEQAGTSKDYSGLWRDVQKYLPPAPDASLPELVESARVSSLASAMVQIDRSFDRLKGCQEAGWIAPPTHPDLVPEQEALLVQEGFHEAARNLAQTHGESLGQWLRQAERQATQLRSAISNGNSEAAGRHFALLGQACKQCHHAYRNQ